MNADAFAALKLKFRARCADDLAVLSAAAPGAAAGADLRQRIHRLAGMAGSLGFDELGRMARAVDILLQASDALDGAEVEALRGALVDVAKAA